jgi:hypothetical protein
MQRGSSGAKLRILSFRNIALAAVSESFVLGGSVAEVSPMPEGLHATVELHLEGSMGLTTIGCGDLHPPRAATRNAWFGDKS